jgi:hypothetical protein
MQPPITGAVSTWTETIIMIFTNDQVYKGLYCRCYFQVSSTEFNRLFALQFDNNQKEIQNILKGKEPTGFDFPCPIKNTHKVHVL